MFDENAFTTQHMDFITAFCKKSHAKLEEDDKLSACMLGFLHAIRVYNSNHGSFELFAKACMENTMRKQEDDMKQQKRAEHYKFSLDQIYSTPDGEYTPADFISDRNDDFIDNALLNILVDGLNDDTKKLYMLFTYGYSRDEIR